MIRKKHGGKKKKTYKPKFAKEFPAKKKKIVRKEKTWIDDRESKAVLPNLSSSDKKLKVGNLPPQDHFRRIEDQAYAYPPFKIVIILGVILAVLVYLLF